MMSVVGTIGVFKREFGTDAKVWDQKIVLIPDHYIFTADERANRNVDILRSPASKALNTLRHHRPSEL